MGLSRRSTPEHAKPLAKTVLHVSSGRTGLCAHPPANLRRSEHPVERSKRHASRSVDSRFYIRACHLARRWASDAHRRSLDDTRLPDRDHHPKRRPLRTAVSHTAGSGFVTAGSGVMLDRCIPFRPPRRCITEKKTKETQASRSLIALSCDFVHITCDITDRSQPGEYSSKFNPGSLSP
jgi:hypothetical protein